MQEVITFFIPTMNQIFASVEQKLHIKEKIILNGANDLSFFLRLPHFFALLLYFIFDFS